MLYIIICIYIYISYIYIYILYPSFIGEVRFQFEALIPNYDDEIIVNPIFP